MAVGSVLVLFALFAGLALAIALIGEYLGLDEPEPPG
jgi:hypothetical protein